ELTPAGVAVAEPPNHARLGAPSHAAARIAGFAHLCETVTDDDRAAVGCKQAAEDPAARAVGVLDQPPALHHAHDLHWQAPPTIDPFDREILARSNSHVDLASAQRGPVGDLALLGSGRP